MEANLKVCDNEHFEGRLLVFDHIYDPEEKTNLTSNLSAIDLQ